jgi:hypothetical protein
MRWFWGLLVLSIGVLLLGQNFNFWGSQNFSELLQYWPLILILFGIALICKHLKVGWIIILFSYFLAFAFIIFIAPNHRTNNLPKIQNIWQSIKDIRK